MGADDGVETVAFQTLHGQVGASLMFAEFVDGYDVGMLKVGGGFGLAEEAMKKVGLVRVADRHDLDGDHAIEKRVFGPIDDAHAAFADDIDNIVLPDFLG